MKRQLRVTEGDVQVRVDEAAANTDSTLPVCLNAAQWEQIRNSNRSAATSQRRRRAWPVAQIARAPWRDLGDPKVANETRYNRLRYGAGFEAVICHRCNNYGLPCHPVDCLVHTADDMDGSRVWTCRRCLQFKANERREQNAERVRVPLKPLYLTSLTWTLVDPACWPPKRGCRKQVPVTFHRPPAKTRPPVSTTASPADRQDVVDSPPPTPNASACTPELSSLWDSSESASEEWS